MSFLKSIAGASVFALSLGLFITTDANAQYFGANHHLSGVQAQTRANLDNQRAVMDNKITTSLNAGQINMMQANNFRAQLSQNSSMQASMLSDGFLSVGETQQLINAMNAIDTNLNSIASTFVNTNPSYAVNYDSRYRGGRHLGLGADLQNRMNRLSNRMERARANGTLSNAEYSMLRNAFNRVSSRNSQDLVDNGGLDRFERTKALDRIARLESRLNSEISDRNFTAGAAFNYYY